MRIINEETVEVKSIFELVKWNILFMVFSSIIVITKSIFTKAAENEFFECHKKYYLRPIDSFNNEFRINRMERNQSWYLYNLIFGDKSIRKTKINKNLELLSNNNTLVSIKNTIINRKVNMQDGKKRYI